MSKREYWIIFLGAMMVGAVGGMYMLNATQILSSLVQEWGFTDQQAGLTTTMHTLGSLIGLIVIFIKVEELNIHKWMYGAMAATFLSEALIAFSGQPEVVIALRLVAGFASGLALALAMVLMGYLPNTERVFALAISLSFVSAIITMYLWPFILEYVGMSGVFWYFSLYALICLPFIRLLPFRVQNISTYQSGDQNFGASDLFRGFPLVILVSYFLFYIGNTAIWTFAGQIGVSQGLVLEEVTEILAYAMLSGLLASIIASVIGNRLGYTISFVLGLGTIIFGTLTMFDLQTTDSYFLAFALFNFGFSFAIPYYQGLQSRFDSNGRLLIMGLMATSAGFAVGPALASMIIEIGDYSNLFWLGLICFGGSLVLIQGVVVKSMGVSGRENAVSQSAS